MSTTSAARPLPIVDGKLAKRLVLVCGIVPGLLLLWDAYQGQLGVNDINFAIRSTGMLGLVFLSLSLVITPLRRLTGWNALIGVRRNLGVYGFLYIAAHFAIFFVFDREGSVGSTLDEIVERVYLWFGTGSLVLMIPLAITSTDAMVTRLGAKRWKALHRLAYVAVLAGVIHYYLLVKSDTTQPIAFAIVFGGLMGYRIVRHYLDLQQEVRTAHAKLAAARAAGKGPKKRKFWSGELAVARIFQETPDVKTFRMVATDGGPLPFDYVAGQYLNLALTIDGKRVNRSYTIASSPTRAGYCEISVKRDGLASRHLHETLREGDRLKVSAPAGKFVFAGHEAERVVLLAGGVGITPMMSVVRSLTDRCWTGEIYLIFSVRKLHDIVFERELAYLQARFPNLHVLVTLTGDPDVAWDGKRGHISRELIEGFVPNLTRGPVLMCGPAKMMVAARKLLVEIGVPDAEVLEEAFVSPPPAAEPAAPSGDPALDAARAALSLEPATELVPGEVPSVRFQRSGATAELPSELTVLEAAEDAGVRIPFECRSGICGQCKTRLVAGRVTMEVQDALTPADKAKGLVLACQARAVRDVVIDA
jgi:ferredoxin-NADP reductase/DMSO/TMAO reductase YedYZ heme-binding membrane subunit